MSENESMLEIYVLENSQLLEQLEELFLASEQDAQMGSDQINETFRVMHTLKGSSAMMGFDALTSLSHTVEDMFSKIRDQAIEPSEKQWMQIFDVVLRAIDFFKEEMHKIDMGETPDGTSDEMCKELGDLLYELDSSSDEGPKGGQNLDAQRQKSDATREMLNQLSPSADDKIYRLELFFDEGSQMETVRTFGVVNSLEGLYSSMVSIPDNLDENHDEVIVSDGFLMLFTAHPEDIDLIEQKLQETLFLKSMELSEVEPLDEDSTASEEQTSKKKDAKSTRAANNAALRDNGHVKQSFISVNVNRIDKLMNLVGEIITTESMVTKNPDLEDMHLESFDKQARQLRKLTDELQDIVMSIRMVPVASTFHKMRRIVRDINKSTNKNAQLVIKGEDTEVDKNVIDALSDPLLHLIRNAMDHGMETPEERIAAGKPEQGTVILEALSSGGDVVVRVQDDGRGYDKEKIYEIAVDRGLTDRPIGEIPDSEIYEYTLAAGFSTNTAVSEYSGRGVGMDVVRNNIDSIGGSISIESEQGVGSTVTMHIPLTLAILNGMKINVGESLYIIPILAIRESLEPRLHEIIVDPNGNEMIMIRGECYPIIRLHSIFGVEEAKETFNEGIMVLVETEMGAACLFADQLLGEQQIVIKPMPSFVTRTFGRIPGIAGCSVMGDGSVALILDISRIMTHSLS